jgi:hypothetical protein
MPRRIPSRTQKIGDTMLHRVPDFRGNAGMEESQQQHVPDFPGNDQ